MPDCRSESSRLLHTVSTRAAIRSSRKIFCGLKRVDLLYSGDTGWEVNGIALAVSLP